ncbi:DUF3515 family protein [Frigoribacterium sp. CFBP 13707]|uniref:DUF3515 family protein n=1 Tax=Frigoribacterium sp. CFBP 13707 TaxID=2775313 RepID=UPI00177C372B|nr:DUF3515 family protein [Frigoribacterium sp. CFBP 13707]MBD8729518.1 DUF3515 family protein [Frigoribacterium sp. CFBP 13707]
MRAVAAGVVVVVVVGASLAGCVAAVPMSSADEANAVGCAQVTVHLPETIAETEVRRETDAQATGAWGEPASVLLRCGVTEPGPTDLPCYTIQGVDWIVDSPQDDPDTAILTTYGRSPAVEVVFDTTTLTGASVMGDLADAVGYLPANGRACTSAEDLTS